jgi:transketolase C-terminal domain/subunit
VTIIAAGIMVSEALEAKELLMKEGIDAGVINMACISRLIQTLLLQQQRHRD